MTAHTAYSGYDPWSATGKTLFVEGGRVSEIVPCEDRDLPILSPGLIDLQVNGFRGHDLNSDNLEPETVEALCEELRACGISSFLPTLITASEDALCQRLGAIKTAKQSLPLSAEMIAGVHVEGPSISPNEGARGAHPADQIRPPSQAEFDRWQFAADGLVKIVTIAPEVDGAGDYIQSLSSAGVLVALGHSDASGEDIARAAKAGACMSTHLGNGIPAVLPRHPNAIWAQLSEDRLCASLILDGHHLSRDTARAMIRAKGVENTILVSDSVKFAGMAPGRYQSPIGGEVDVSSEGRVTIAGEPYLAGSGACLLDIVCRFQSFTGFPLVDALTMATHTPARLLGQDPGFSVGARADFILFHLDQGKGIASPKEIVFNGISVQR